MVAFDAKTFYGALLQVDEEHPGVTDEQSLRSAFKALSDAGSLFPGN
eukprot:COSAG03_NODE_2662_length_2536_cov_1.940792_1_plen_47_part_00